MVEYVLYICIFVSIYKFQKKKCVYKNGVKISKLDAYLYVTGYLYPGPVCEIKYIINIQVIIFSWTYMSHVIYNVYINMFILEALLPICFIDNIYFLYYSYVYRVKYHEL